MILLVAWREFSERLRSRLFLGVNVFLLLVVIGAVALPAVFGGPEEAVRLGVNDPTSQAVAAAARAQQDLHMIDFEVSEVEDERDGRAALARGELDVVLVDGERLLADSEVRRFVEAALNAAAQAVRLDAALDEAGVPAGDRAELLAPEPLRVELLERDAETAEEFGPAVVVTLVAVALLYGLLAFNGQWVAQGIIEEKQSRVVELLLSSVRPFQLLGGKVLGLGALGLAQITLLAAVGLGALAAFGEVDIPGEARLAILLAVAWYVLGYGLYAALFAIAGALSARMEDLQSTTAPVIVVLVGALVAAQVATGAPRSTFAAIAAYVPFTAPMVQPVRIATGTSTPVEAVGAAVITVLFAALLVPLAGRLYKGGALQTRTRVSLRAAWTAADR